MLRVECRAVRTWNKPDPRAPIPPLLISLWFSADQERVLLRIDVDDDGARARALLIERDVLSQR